MNVPMVRTTATKCPDNAATLPVHSRALVVLVMLAVGSLARVTSKWTFSGCFCSIIIEICCFEKCVTRCAFFSFLESMSSEYLNMLRDSKIHDVWHQLRIKKGCRAVIFSSDIDECTSGLHDCDIEAGESCVNNDGSYTCHCPRGFAYNQDLKQCGGMLDWQMSCGIFLPFCFFLFISDVCNSVLSSTVVTTQF